jgi:uncharacterized membrane protein YkvA (DUF1232 family)
MLSQIRSFASKIVEFVKNVAGDSRIPERDKKVILICVALIVSPFDIIPDWLPIVGLMDDLIIFAVVLDYLFNVLDQNILLTHYPWGMKSYLWLRRTARTITWMTPETIKQWIWKYKPDPF